MALAGPDQVGIALVLEDREAVLFAGQRENGLAALQRQDEPVGFWMVGMV